MANSPIQPLQERADAHHVPTGDSRKPDPDEPWRYVCPECGGQPLRECSKTSYRCSRCRSFWDRDELRDLKDGGDDG